METVQEREERIRRLEEGREQRKAGSVWPTPDDSGTGGIPVEIAPGRGDLNRSISGPFVPVFPTALALTNRSVSFARLFQSQPWIAAAVMRMLTWSVSVPLKAYRRVGLENSKERVLPGEHPIADAIHNPWTGGCMAGLVQNLLGPLLINGNSITEIDEGAGGKIQFTPKDWRYVIPIMPWRDTLVGFEVDVDNAARRRSVSLDKMAHIAWWSPTGPIGTSPLQQLGVTMNIEDAAQRFQRSMFVNGARPGGAITASEEFLGLERPEREKILAQLRADITALFAGPENAGRPALLPPGLEWKDVGQTTVEAELIAQRKVAREEVCAVYQIPPPMLGILDRATYANIETQREMTYTDALGPPLILIEQSLNAQLIRDLLRVDDIFVEFDFAGALRGNRLKEIQALREAVASALMTPNEGRDVINAPRSENPGMDEFYLPVNNLQPVGTPPAQAPVPGPPAGNNPGQADNGRNLLVRSRDADYEMAVR